MSCVESQCVSSFLVASLESGSGYSAFKRPKERTPDSGVPEMIRHPRKRGMSFDRRSVYLRVVSVSWDQPLSKKTPYVYMNCSSLAHVGVFKPQSSATAASFLLVCRTGSAWVTAFITPWAKSLRTPMRAAFTNLGSASGGELTGYYSTTP